MQGDAVLLQIVNALRPPACLASGLDRRQQKGHEDPDDRNNDQQFDERKCTK
jgi:hypothetical protein